MSVDRRSAVPLWSQVLEDLRARLAAGEFTDSFPGDLELTARYQVSRQTVREALRRLQAEGLIERGRGRGTVVSQRPVEQQLGTLYSLFRSAEEQGFVQESVVRFLELRRNEEAASMLGCAAEDPLVYLERIRLVDGRPVVLDCSWVPGRLASPLLDADFRHTALYREMESRCGLRPDAGWERVSPALPTPEQRQLLGLPARVPVYRVERLACQGRMPVEWRHGVVRADRFRFVARWGAGKLGAAFEPPEGQGGGSGGPRQPQAPVVTPVGRRPP